MHKSLRLILDQLSVTKEHEIIIEQEAVLQRRKIELGIIRTVRFAIFNRLLKMEFLIEETRERKELEKLRRDQEGTFKRLKDERSSRQRMMRLRLRRAR